MPDTYVNTGDTADYASKMPDFGNDADVQKALQAYHYGDPVNASAGSFTSAWDDPDVGIIGKLLYLNDTITSLGSSSVAKSLYSAKGVLLGASAASTPVALTVGTNGFIIKANSSTSSGLEWYDPDTTHINLNPGSQVVVGDMTFTKASPTILLNAAAAAQTAGIAFRTAAADRWRINKNSIAEAGSDAGSNFVINRYSDAGALLGTSLEITRSTGLTTLSSLAVTGKITTAATTTGSAGINLPHGTAPTSPVNGDMWTTTAGAYVRVNGVNIAVALSAGMTYDASQISTGVLLAARGGTGVSNTGTLTLSGNTTIGSSTHTVAFATTNNTSVTLPTSGTLAVIGTGLNQFASTTSAQLAGVLSDETGSGLVVFNNSPTLAGTPLAPTAAVDTNTTQIATTAYVIGQAYAKLAGPTFTGTVTAATLNLSTAVTATAASHYWVETGSDSIVRPKTLANVKTEVVTTAAVNAAAATTLGTITSGTWQGSVIGATYIDSAIARLASPTFTGSVTVPTPTTAGQASTKGYIDGLLASNNSTTVARMTHRTVTGTTFNLLGGVTVAIDLTYLGWDAYTTDAALTAAGIYPVAYATNASSTNPPSTTKSFGSNMSCLLNYSGGWELIVYGWGSWPGSGESCRVNYTIVY